MKKIFSLLLLSMFCLPTFSQTKYKSLYKHGLTHTELITETNNEEVIYNFVIHGAEMWTGVNRTGLIFKGDLKQMTEFLSTLDAYANTHKSPSDTLINNVTVVLKKVAGINCISFDCGDFERNTNKKAVKNTLTAIKKL